MPPDTLLLFGDQTGDVLVSLQELSRLGQRCETLSGFLRRATDRLQKAIAKAPSQYRRRFPFFDSPAELAVAVEKHGVRSPALMSPLLCIAQLGHLIMYISKICCYHNPSLTAQVILNPTHGHLTAQPPNPLCLVFARASSQQQLLPVVQT